MEGNALHSLCSAFGQGWWTDMSLEGASAEAVILDPQYEWEIYQEDVVDANSVPGLKRETETPSREGVLREEPCGDVNPQAAGAAAASLGLLESALGQLQDSMPGFRLPMPGVTTQGQPWAIKKPQVTLQDFGPTRSLGDLCDVLLDLPKSVLDCAEHPASVGGTSSRPRQTTDEGVDCLGGGGGSPEVHKVGGLPFSPDRPPRRARRKRRQCGICFQNGEEADCFLGPGQSRDRDSQPMQGLTQSAALTSFGGTRRPPFPQDTGPGDPGGRSAVYASGVEEFEHMFTKAKGSQLGGPDLGFPEFCERESRRLTTQVPPGSPTVYPGELVRAAMQWDSLPVFRVGNQEGPCALHYPEEPEVEVKGQWMSRKGQRQRRTLSPDTCGGSRESLGSLRDASVGQRRPSKKQRLKGPVSYAPKQRTGSPDQGDPEEARPGRWPRLEEARTPHGVKLVCYLWSGTVIRLLGAISHSQAGVQLEALKNLMEVSSGPVTPRPRRKRRPVTWSPPESQFKYMETEDGEPLQQGAEDPGQLQAQQETVPLDIGVRSTVVRAIQEALWTRIQELPDLVLTEEEVEAIAEGIEAALFHLTQDTNLRYKTKYRSLLFNLRDPRNSDLFLKVAHCDVTPHDLVRMSSIQLAPQELSRWRDQEERRGLEIIERQQKELYRLPPSKLTHKGEVEIPRDAEQILTLEDLVEPTVPRECSPQAQLTQEETVQPHPPHTPAPDCLICKDGRGAAGASVADGKPSSELSGFSEATVNREDRIIQRASSPAPLSSPEVLKAREPLPKEPQDRLQMPTGPTNALSSLPPWEGMLDMFSIKRFRAKAQLVSGHTRQLVQALPEVIRSAGCLPPNAVWDLLASLCPAGTKDVCVVRLCPHGTRDIQNYRLLYSYLNNKQSHCLAAVQCVAVVLLPLPAFQPLPNRLRPLGGPGLEATHSSLLLAVLLPKDQLPETAMSNPVWGKVRKTVSFNRKVEMRCYQPEDRKSEITPRSTSRPEEAPEQNQAKGSLAPRGICAWQSLPRGRGRQGPGRGQQPSEAGRGQPVHPDWVAAIVPGFGRGRHPHRASCLQQGLFQHLKALVTMSHQLQASLWPAGPELSAQPPEVPESPGPAPHPFWGCTDGAGSECSLP